MQMQNLLEFDHVDIHYGRKQAVFDVSFTVPQGTIFGLIGLNGAGKTTLIKALLGLRETQSGRILLNGLDSGRPANRRMLAYLPERFDPPSFLKGSEFIRFSAGLYGQAYDPSIASALAVRLKLDPAVLDTKMTTYSKGMRQKVGLIATVMTGCSLLILDEPMSGLDPAARASVKSVLQEVKREGRTIFFSSHILSDMDEICERVTVINKGRVAYEGTPLDLKHQGGGQNLEQAFLNVIGENESFAPAA
jgi:ABC-2 type transport system ATP-binding protein